jgi:hypothetical protein
VNSSWVKSIGYDADSLTLEVEFVHGAVFQYFEVPLEVFIAFQSADSKGAFINQRIRKGRYRYQRLRPL